MAAGRGPVFVSVRAHAGDIHCVNAAAMPGPYRAGEHKARK